MSILKRTRGDRRPDILCDILLPISPAKTASYTLAIGDGTVPFDCTSGPLTANLPPFAAAHYDGNGPIYSVVKSDVSVNLLSVVVPGLGTLAMGGQGSAVLLQATATGYVMLADSRKSIADYASPAASGTVVNMQDTDQDGILVITPVANYAAMTVNLPSNATFKAGRERKFTCSRAVVTLTWGATSGNAPVIQNAPAALSGGEFYILTELSSSGGTSTWALK